MTQEENIQQDTPQSNTNETSQYDSLEEAVFGEGSKDITSSAFTSGNEGNTEPAPQGQPAVSNQGNAQTQASNDDTRYQYWQSQADKYKNELEAMQQQVNQQQQPVLPPQGAPQQAQPDGNNAQAFPPPPGKPQKPRTYNREEAYNDPSSDSARYLDELEGWRDDMNEYNTLKSEYNTAVIEDKFNAMQAQRVEAAKRQQAAQQAAAQEHEIKTHLTGHYGMQENEAKDFMTKMSDPNSITIDNLVQLYRLQGSANTEKQNVATPSEAFTQTQNAQQVPSPMGVMPSGNTNVDGRSAEDKIMDTMIGNFNSKNPWK